VRTHLLLDLDGTLSDSSPGIGRSLQHAFERCGYAPPSDDAVRAAIGPPFELTFPGLGVPHHDIARVVAAYRERYETIGLFENELYPGIVEMLDALAVDYTLAVATAKPEPTAVRIIEHFGLTSYFAVQAGATFEVGAGRRTKGQVIAYALEQLDVEPGEHVVMIGDRDHDVEGALEHGLDCIGVTWGFGSHDELRQAGATAIVERPGDVAAAVAATYRAGRT
jgi:phosphoglycolate phosphatase